MLVMALYNFVDVFWLSKVGSSAIAAWMSFPLQMIFGAIGIGTGIGAVHSFHECSVRNRSG